MDEYDGLRSLVADFRRVMWLGHSADWCEFPLPYAGPLRFRVRYTPDSLEGHVIDPDGGTVARLLVTPSEARLTLADGVARELTPFPPPGPHGVSEMAEIVSIARGYEQVDDYIEEYFGDVIAEHYDEERRRMERKSGSS